MADRPRDLFDGVTLPEIQLEKAYQNIKHSDPDYKKYSKHQVKKLDVLFNNEKFIYNFKVMVLGHMNFLDLQKEHPHNHHVQKTLEKMLRATEYLYTQLMEPDPVTDSLLFKTIKETSDIKFFYEMAISLAKLNNHVYEALDELENGDHSRRDYTRLSLALTIKSVLYWQNVRATTYCGGLWHLCYKIVLTALHREISDDAITSILKEASKISGQGICHGHVHVPPNFR